jgi:hypothetical protein
MGAAKLSRGFGLESAHEYLQTAQIPTRYHFLHRLALLPIQYVGGNDTFLVSLGSIV